MESRAKDAGSDDEGEDALLLEVAKYLSRKSVGVIMRLLIAAAALVPWLSYWIMPASRRLISFDVESPRSQFGKVLFWPGGYILGLGLTAAFLASAALASGVSGKVILMRVDSTERVALLKLLIWSIVVRISAFLALVVGLRWSIAGLAPEESRIPGKLATAKDTLARLYPVGENPSLPEYLDAWRASILILSLALVLYTMFEISRFSMMSRSTEMVAPQPVESVSTGASPQLADSQEKTSA